MKNTRNMSGYLVSLGLLATKFALPFEAHQMLGLHYFKRQPFDLFTIIYLTQFEVFLSHST